MTFYAKQLSSYLLLCLGRANSTSLLPLEAYNMRSNSYLHSPAKRHSTFHAKQFGVWNSLRVENRMLLGREGRWESLRVESRKIYFNKTENFCFIHIVKKRHHFFKLYLLITF